MRWSLAARAARCTDCDNNGREGNFLRASCRCAGADLVDIGARRSHGTGGGSALSVLGEEPIVGTGQPGDGGPQRRVGQVQLPQWQDLRFGVPDRMAVWVWAVG